MSKELAKCEGGECPIKEDCMRYIIPENDHIKCYLLDEPFKINGKLFECKYYAYPTWGHGIKIDLETNKITI